MTKEWKNKTTEEKLEALREDVARAFQAINDITKEHNAFSSKLEGAVSLAKEALEKAERLDGR